MKQIPTGYGDVRQAASLTCHATGGRRNFMLNLSWTPPRLRRRGDGRRHRPNAAVSFVAPWQMSRCRISFNYRGVRTIATSI